MSVRDLGIEKRIESLDPEKRALLFRQLQKKRDGQGPAVKTTIPRREREANTAPLSFAQQRLWFLDQYEPNSPEYNMPFAIQMRGALDQEALRRTLQAIVARHETLRTTFTAPAADADPVQVIADQGSVTLPVVDLSHLPPVERQTEAQSYISQEAQRPFDLSSGPLLRTSLLRLADDEHILLLTMHHIIFDGWSHGVFMRELSALYRAFSAGEPSPLAALPIQYADFAVWQREWLQGDALEQQLSYWRQQLAHTPPLDLPTDRPRPAIRTYVGTMETLLLPQGLSEALKTLSQQEGATLFMTLLAAFKVLLHRYTGQSDIALGSQIANRRWGEIEPLIGFFANTLVLRSDLSGDPSFQALLHRVREMALEAYAHQDLPFEKLVDELNLKRDTSRTPLFQAMFILQNAPQAGAGLPGLSLSPTQADSRTAKFDLTLYMTDTANGLLAELEYNTDLFDAATVQRLLGHFQTLLAGIVADPGQAISELPLLTAAERQQALTAWNDTQADYPRDRCIHELFEAQVERTPQAIAVIFGQEELTYRQLNERANRLAHRLRRLGVRQGDLVGVCLERSAQMLIGVLGVLKAGGAYVPLDPGYPQERLAYIVADTGLAALLADRAQAGLAEGLRGSAPLLVVDETWDEERLDNLAGAGLAEGLAYVIHTSGSTGRPKGVQIAHRAVVNFLCSLAERPGLTAADRLVAVTTLSFDIAGLELYLPLLVGGRVVIASSAAAADGEQLAALLAGSGATVMQATPATWRLLVGVGWRPAEGFKALCGGEALPRELANELLGRGVALWNMYGPTETTIWSATGRIEAGAGAVRIGAGIANTRIYVLDGRLGPVAVGVAGEMYIGGEGLSWGYLKRAGLTAERFVPDPYDEAGGGRLYRTGDVVRRLGDGGIEFLGRLDHQVKVRGFRIELGEIEAVLRRHPEVAEAVVIVREDAPGDKRLVAYVAGVEGPTTSELRRFVKQSLPDYMTPALFVPLEALPLTPNGKVDRRALPMPDSSRPELESAYVAPGTAQEQTLASIWAELLGLEQVGVHDNFFELGGDSLMVLRVVSKAREAGLELTAKQFFQHQTIAELAAEIGAVQITAEQGLVTGLTPMTFAMHQFFELNHPNPHFYNLSWQLEERQPMNPELLETIIDALLRHHDSFRVRLVAGDSGFQLVNDGPDETTPFSVVDLSHLPEDEQLAQIDASRVAIGASLNMFEGSLFRSVLFDLGPDRPNHLLLLGHYLTADVLSWQIFIADLDRAYQRLSRGEPLDLPAKTTSVQQWTTRVDEYVRSPQLLADIPYWLSEPRRQIEALPRDYPEGANVVESSRYASLVFDEEETEALLAVGKAHDTQIHAVLLAGIHSAFACWTGSPHTLIDLFVLGREAPDEDIDLSRTVGWLTFSYPLLLTAEPNTKPAAALQAVATQLRETPSNGIGYPSLRYIHDDRQVARQLRELPQPEVFFNFFGQAPGNFKTFRPVGGFTGHHQDRTATRPRLLSISGYIARGVLELHWEFSENVHEREKVEALVGACEETLKALAALGKTTL